MSAIKIRITADSASEWNEINDELKKLPDNITEQFEHVENTLAGIKCHIRKQYTHPFKLYLPSSTNQIQVGSESVTIHCDDFYLTAPKADYIYIICKP